MKKSEYNELVYKELIASLKSENELFNMILQLIRATYSLQNNLFNAVNIEDIEECVRRSRVAIEPLYQKILEHNKTRLANYEKTMIKLNHGERDVKKEKNSRNKA